MPLITTLLGESPFDILFCTTHISGAQLGERGVQPQGVPDRASGGKLTQHAAQELLQHHEECCEAATGEHLSDRPQTHDGHGW